jgi:alpha-tubulin suppressor-like RCC1 family protein
MGFLVGGWIAGPSGRRAAPMTLVAIVGLLWLAMVSPAHAAPNFADAWGNNEFGQLGDGTSIGPEECGLETRSCSTTPVRISGLSGVTAVAGGEDYGLALLENGTVVAWGENSLGQLGDGTTTARNVPVAVCAAGETAPCANHLSGVKAIAAGGNHSMALREDGAVVAWGLNDDGQLGDGTTTSSDVPAAVCAAGETAPCANHLSGVEAIAVGEYHSLALLKENGAVVAWGRNEDGQLGDGTSTGSDVPVAVCAAGETAPCAKDLSGVKAIAAGNFHSVALLKENGAVVAWGTDGRGQLGDGKETTSDAPVSVSGLTGVRSISAGANHTLALLEGGSVMAWGLNSAGQLGDVMSEGPETCGKLPFTAACAKKPVVVCAERSKSAPPPACGKGLSAVSAVSAGGQHSLALLKENGAVVAWGRNNEGQLGDGLDTGPEGCGSEGSCSTLAVKACAQGAGKATCSENGPFLLGATGIGGGRENSYAFGPPPTVTQLNPSKGSTGGGAHVAITGEDFTGTTEVKFGSSSAVSFTVTSPTSISAVAPAESAGTVDVTVTNQWGTSATSSADQYTYVQGLQELPEIGRCVSKPGSGGFKGLKPVCIVKSPTHTGNFEWLPGPGANRSIKLKLSQPTFETVNGRRIVCAYLFASGELTGAKTLRISGQTQIQGCALQPENLACYSNPLEPNQIVSETPLVGELGFIPGSTSSTPWVGWDLKAESGTSKTMFEFSCGESGTFPPPPPTFEVSLEGSVIGRVKPTNKMVASKVFSMTYKQEHGIQKPTAFIGGVEDVLTQITTPHLNPHNPKVEQAGLQGGGEMELGEPMEIKAK